MPKSDVPSLNSSVDLARALAGKRIAPTERAQAARAALAHSSVALFPSRAHAASFVVESVCQTLTKAVSATDAAELWEVAALAASSAELAPLSLPPALLGTIERALADDVSASTMRHIASLIDSTTQCTTVSWPLTVESAASLLLQAATRIETFPGEDKVKASLALCSAIARAILAAPATRTTQRKRAVTAAAKSILPALHSLESQQVLSQWQDVRDVCDLVCDVFVAFTFGESSSAVTLPQPILEALQSHPSSAAAAVSLRYCGERAPEMLPNLLEALGDRSAAHWNARAAVAEAAGAESIAFPAESTMGDSLLLAAVQAVKASKDATTRDAVCRFIAALFALDARLSDERGEGAAAAAFAADADTSVLAALIRARTAVRKYSDAVRDTCDLLMKHNRLVPASSDVAVAIAAIPSEGGPRASLAAWKALADAVVRAVPSRSARWTTLAPLAKALRVAGTTRPALQALTTAGVGEQVAIAAESAVTALNDRLGNTSQNRDADREVAPWAVSLAHNCATMAAWCRKYAAKAPSVFAVLPEAAVRDASADAYSCIMLSTLVENAALFAHPIPPEHLSLLNRILESAETNTAFMTSKSDDQVSWTETFLETVFTYFEYVADSLSDAAIRAVALLALSHRAKGCGSAASAILRRDAALDHSAFAREIVAATKTLFAAPRAKRRRTGSAQNTPIDPQRVAAAVSDIPVATLRSGVVVEAATAWSSAVADLADRGENEAICSLCSPLTAAILTLQQRAGMESAAAGTASGSAAAPKDGDGTRRNPVREEGEDADAATAQNDNRFTNTLEHVRKQCAAALSSTMSREAARAVLAVADLVRGSTGSSTLLASLAYCLPPFISALRSTRKRKRAAKDHVSIDALYVKLYDATLNEKRPAVSESARKADATRNVVLAVSRAALSESSALKLASASTSEVMALLLDLAMELLESESVSAEEATAVTAVLGAAAEDAELAGGAALLAGTALLQMASVLDDTSFTTCAHALALSVTGAVKSGVLDFDRALELCAQIAQHSDGHRAEGAVAAPLIRLLDEGDHAQCCRLLRFLAAPLGALAPHNGNGFSGTLRALASAMRRCSSGYRARAARTELSHVVAALSTQIQFLESDIDVLCALAVLNHALMALDVYTPLAGAAPALVAVTVHALGARANEAPQLTIALSQVLSTAVRSCPRDAARAMPQLIAALAGLVAAAAAAAMARTNATHGPLRAVARAVESLRLAAPAALMHNAAALVQAYIIALHRIGNIENVPYDALAGAFHALDVSDKIGVRAVSARVAPDERALLRDLFAKYQKEFKYSGKV